jgi:hypothetical protein
MRLTAPRDRFPRCCHLCWYELCVLALTARYFNYPARVLTVSNRWGTVFAAFQRATARAVEHLCRTPTCASCPHASAGWGLGPSQETWAALLVDESTMALPPPVQPGTLRPGILVGRRRFFSLVLHGTAVPTMCVCLLLQYLIQSCARGGRRIVEDMCYEIRQSEACVD